MIDFVTRLSISTFLFNCIVILYFSYCKNAPRLIHGLISVYIWKVWAYLRLYSFQDTESVTLYLHSSPRLLFLRQFLFVSPYPQLQPVIAIPRKHVGMFICQPVLISQ